MVANFFSWKSIKVLGKEWWFLLLVGLPQCLPPYTSHGYRLPEWGMVNAYILAHPIKASFLTGFYPLFQVIPLALLLAILLLGKKVNRLFSAYVAVMYVTVAFLQNVSISERYGLAVCTANVLTFLVLAGFWLRETISPQNDFSPRQPPAWRYGALLLAFLPFWGPVNPLTLGPDFNPMRILTSGSGLSFCLSTPLYLAILSLYFPHVNKPVFVATAFVGVMMGLGNLALEFVIYPSWWWIGVLHIPLFVISLYCLALALFAEFQLAK